MNNHENNKWLDDLLSKAIGSEKPKADFEQWKKKHPHAVETLTSRADSKPMSLLIIRNIMMKNPITKFAAAAVIIVGIILFSHFSNGKFDLASNAFAQMTDNMKKMPWLHTIMEGTDSGETNLLEGWISYEFQIFATKKSSGEVEFDSEGLQRHYDPATEIITVSRQSNIELENVGSVWEYWENMINFLTENNAEIISNEEAEGKRKTIYKVTSSPFEETMELKLIIDIEKNLPIFFNNTILDSDGDIVSEINADFDYPETGPKDIYDLGVPKDVRIVDRTYQQGANLR